MIVVLDVHPSTMMIELRPLMMTVDDVRFPLIVVVVAPEGITMVVELMLPGNVHVPPMQIHSGDGRVDGEHSEGDVLGVGEQVPSGTELSASGGGTENEHCDGYFSWQ